MVVPLTHLFESKSCFYNILFRTRDAHLTAGRWRWRNTAAMLAFVLQHRVCVRACVCVCVCVCVCAQLASNCKLLQKFIRVQMPDEIVIRSLFEMFYNT
jgi:hypothetical protein